MQKQIEQCVRIDQFEKLQEAQNKNVTTISVFNTKMKTFERLYLTKKNEEEIENTEKKINNNLSDVFKKPDNQNEKDVLAK